ncbi:hypothetical protein PIB30_065810 [Stylosanthes scabra]|uniref:Uncharacterized protein n=1 Tax=Stylosanthes scabra TaxID=79078 RepID=A0ABU6UN39_9FABA|nr:hypothetical protein [Stylosanthes scabra]
MLGIDSWTLERWKDDVFMRPRRKGRLGVWGGRLGVGAGVTMAVEVGTVVGVAGGAACEDDPAS